MQNEASAPGEGELYDKDGRVADSEIAQDMAETEKPHIEREGH